MYHIRQAHILSAQCSSNVMERDMAAYKEEHPPATLHITLNPKTDPPACTQTLSACICAWQPCTLQATASVLAGNRRCLGLTSLIPHVDCRQALAPEVDGGH